MVSSRSAAIRKRQVLLVLFDGFRWDYLQRYNTSWFHQLAKEGATTTNNTYQPAFVTKSFPNLFSIVTGLHEESHGIVDNYMFDPVTGASFSLRNKSSGRDPGWWNAEPIWITVERSGKRSGTFFWPGSEVSYNGLRQKFWKIFDKTIPFSTRVNTVIHWLSKEDVSFATLYFEEPDLIGHSHGPFSYKTQKVVESLNNVVGELVMKMKKANIYNNVDLILTSDHGMSECKFSNIIPFYKILQKHTTLIRRIVSFGAFFGIHPKSDATMLLYTKLKREIQEKQYSMIRVYLKEDIPQRLHYKRNRRIPEIIVFAEEGYFILSKMPRRMKKIETFGCHGYDNSLDSMLPFFIARGPQILPESRIPSFQQVDIYAFLAKLLSVKPRPNNGTLDNLSHILYDEASPNFSNIHSAASRNFLFLSRLSTILFVIFVNSICISSQ